MAERLYSIAQASTKTGIPERTIRRRCKNGIVGTQVSGVWTLNDSDLDKLRELNIPRGRPPKQG